jgi:ribosomal protein L21E
MKNIIAFIAFCCVVQMQAQTNEHFYKGNKGKKVRQQGQNINIETCDGGSTTTLNIDSTQEVVSESKQFNGSCSDESDVQLTDKAVLKFKISKFGDTLFMTKFKDNGRLTLQKSTAKSNISRFQQKMIRYDDGGYVASYITYPPAGRTQAVVGYVMYDKKGNEIAQKTVDSLVDASPFAQLLDGATDTDFYVLQGTHTQCGKFKLHKISNGTKVWTTTLSYDLGCNIMTLQSFAINKQNTRLGLLFTGTTTVAFNKYFMVDNTTGAIIPTTFDISTRVRYNTKTAFGKNNDVHFARVIDYNSVNSRVPDRSALELLRFDVNQNRLSQKKYFDGPKKDTDTIPQLEDMMVANDGTVLVTGSRLKKTWLFSSNEAPSGTANAAQQSTRATNIRQVTEVPNSPNIVVEVESDSNRDVRLEIVNALGQIVRTENRSLQQGVNALSVDFGNQVRGTYTVKLNGVVENGSFVFVKM